MAEVFVPLLETLANVALKELQEHTTLVVDVKDKVDDLSTKLTAIKNMLRDVEMKKLKEEDQPVGVWLQGLQNLAYEMDDVLDQWITETCKLKIKASQNASSSRRKREKVRSTFLPICFCIKEVSMRHDIALKIRELNGKVDHILTQAKNFEFTTIDHRDSSKSENKPPLSIPIFNESEVCGREYDEITIINKLLNINSSNIKENQIPVVSVVGVGGIGKTTLAKKVFNDSRVKEHFDHKIWVSVSSSFEEKRIAKAILEVLGTDDAGDESVALFNRIKESLENKKFLLVLDDVWTEDYSKWTPFRDTLKDGATESRILVTTRNEGVAITLGSSHTHLLSPLEDNDSWLILSRNAFSPGSKAVPVRDNVQDIGRKIAKKCQGLPLASSFMGNLLKFKYTVEQWQEVLDSEIWKLKKASEGIFAHLYLSYNELDPEMKRCFSYCAVFPKASTIVVEQLIRIWIAQGFLNSSGNVQQLESRGRECFDTLAMRSFFQDFQRDADDKHQITTCKIHDIVHEFATFLTENECCVVQKVNNQGMAECSDKVRHLSLMPSGDKANLPFTDGRKLRSIFYRRYVSQKLFTSLNSVRVLGLHDCGLQELPKEVGNLIHLRYMDLSNNPLIELPEAISDLYNLETLDVTSCRSLIQLPPKIGNLMKLRCLVNYDTESLRQFPHGFEKLTSLRTLSEFKVGRGYNKLGCLKSLNQLRGSLEIVFLLSDDASDTAYVDAANGELKHKNNIRKLTLRFSNSSMNANVTEALQPPPNLENLILQGYGGTIFPSWMVTSLNYLRVLDIRNSNVPSLPALGKLPSLEILSIYGSGLKVLGRDFLGITESSSSIRVVFPRLKKLSFECLEDWELWEDLTEDEANAINLMPCLTELNLYKCNSLKALPHRILRSTSSLNCLSLKVCLRLLVRYSKLLGDDWKEISHIPNVVKDFD